ncbi:MAG: pilus assembly protein N-terminal domain-containing protein [Xanthobacteraceae bacterium]
MAALCARGWASFSPLHCLSAALMLIAIASPTAADPQAPSPDTIVVFLDQACLVQLPDRAANIVIGNPLIADVSIQPGGLTIITGKSYGATNFIATDTRGVVLMEKAIEVSGPRGRTLVMYNAADRQTYSCTPECSRRLTLGDAPESFDKTLSEITSLNAQATAAGALSAGQIQLDSRAVGTDRKQQQ